MNTSLSPLFPNPYAYIPAERMQKNSLNIQLELPLVPIYYAENKVVLEPTASSVRIYNLFGDEKI